MALTIEQKIEEIALSYQLGKIDAQGVKDQITQLKSQYPKDTALLDQYLSCFESQNYPSICLAEIEAGKATSPGTPPTEKGRFYQLLKPYVKNDPQSQDALDELLVFSDANDINYAEYLDLIKGAQTISGVTSDKLEDILKNLNIKAILFQCLS